MSTDSTTTSLATSRLSAAWMRRWLFGLAAAWVSASPWSAIGAEPARGEPAGVGPVPLVEKQAKRFERQRTLVQARLVGPQQPVTAGEVVTLRLVVEVADNWHIYNPDPGPGGALGSEVSFKSQNAKLAGDVQWPPYKVGYTAGLEAEQYRQHWHGERFEIGIPIRVAELADAGVPVEVGLYYAVCDPNQCLEPHEQVFRGVLHKDGTLIAAADGAGSAATQTPAATQPAAGPVSALTPGGAESAVVSAQADSVVAQSAYTTWQIVLIFATAFLAGVLLNVMPCVLPVLAIKVQSFVQQSGESHARVLALTGAFCAGILLIFALLGLAVATGTTFAGVAVNQGTLMSYPPFVIGMTLVVFLAALSLLGVFELPIPGFAARAAVETDREGLGGAFGKGVFATLLGIPCVGPFMGAALAFASTQGPIAAFLIWFTIGAGMAAPYLVLAVNPRWLKWIPKPGLWMVHFKQAMGFLLIFTVVWFLSTLRREPEYIIGTLVAMTGLGFAAWIWATFVSHREAGRAWGQLSAGIVATACGLVGLAIGAEHKPSVAVVGNDIVAQASAEEWTDWNPQVHAALGERVRLVDFTADWCATCKAVNQPVLNTSEVEAHLASVGGVKLKADWTRPPERPDITAELERVAGSGVSVPVLAVYGPGSDKRVVIVGPITPGQVVAAIDEVAGPGAVAAR